MNARSASTRVSAPNWVHALSPNDVIPTSTSLPSIVANDGPPESPLHLPLPPLWSKHSRLSLLPSSLAHEIDVCWTTYSTPMLPPWLGSVAPNPTIVTVTPTGALAASRL